MSTKAEPQTSAITVRPVYNRLRSLRGYVWGIYAAGKLTAITPRYPSHILRDERSGAAS